MALVVDHVRDAKRTPRLSELRFRLHGRFGLASAFGDTSQQIAQLAFGKCGCAHCKSGKEGYSGRNV